MIQSDLEAPGFGAQHVTALTTEGARRTALPAAISDSINTANKHAINKRKLDVLQQSIHSERPLSDSQRRRARRSHQTRPSEGQGYCAAQSYPAGTGTSTDHDEGYSYDEAYPAYSDNSRAQAHDITLGGG